MSDEVVHKVSPYPIPMDATLTEGQPPFKSSIVKLTKIGFLMQCDQTHYYRVFEVYTVQFTLPVLNAIVRTKAKVIKTYDGLESKIGKEFTKVNTVEMHFVDLTPGQKQAVAEFVQKIGEKP